MAIWRWYGRAVLAPFVVTRLLLLVIGLAVATRDPLSVWSSWDGQWYVSVARDGYVHHGAAQSNTAFAPALPGLMHLLAALLGGADNPTILVVSGLLIGQAALLVALGYLAVLVSRECDAPTARRAVLYVLVFPSTLFLSALYPHALFLACAIGSVYHARRGQWWLAGLLGGLTGLTRLQGALIGLPLLVEYLSQRGTERSPLRQHLLALALVGLGPLVTLLVLAVQTGNPLAMVGAEAAWGRELTWPWLTLQAYLSAPLGPHGTDRSALDLAFTGLLLILAVVGWTRLPRSLALFPCVFLGISLSSGLLVSSMRYGLELFPVFITLAVSGRYRLFHYSYLAVASYLAVRFMFLFAQGAWIA
jgi:hypothetical protein